MESFEAFQVSSSLLRVLAIGSAVPFLVIGAPVRADQGAIPVLRMMTKITEVEVVNAQKLWCGSLLNIGASYRKAGFAAAKSTAELAINRLYAYQYGAVAFKPTLAYGDQTFRPTRQGALAYFIGGDPAFPADKGFALKPCKSCTVRNQVIQLHGIFANTMGNVDFVNASGGVTTVDKTWTFMREPDGAVRIVLHHSSLPYKPAP